MQEKEYTVKQQVFPKRSLTSADSRSFDSSLSRLHSPIPLINERIYEQNLLHCPMRMREPYQAKHECDLQMKGIIASMHCPYCHSKISDESIFCPRCNEQLKQSAMLNTPSERPTEETTYVAFISYRHLPRDTEVAKQVQEAIETYHLPRSIQKAKDNNPDAVKTDRTSKLGKCFRDEDELAASHSLPESIQTALARSHSLIVICSPETKESAWVRREIETAFSQKVIRPMRSLRS